MGKGSLDVGLLVLCTEAERAAIVLEHHPEAIEPLASLGYPAADACERLWRLATDGREAHTAAGERTAELRIAQREGRELAAELYDLHRRARAVLRVAEVHPDKALRPLAAWVRRELTLHAPRLRRAMDDTRRLVDLLDTTCRPLLAVPAMRTLLDEANLLVGRGVDLMPALRGAELRAREASAVRAQCQRDLNQELRRLKSAWKALRALGLPLPDLKFELALRVNATSTPR